MLHTFYIFLTTIYIYKSRDEDLDEAATLQPRKSLLSTSDGSSVNLSCPNPFLELPDTTSAVEYKKGYVMRKCCFDADAKKSKLIIVLLFRFIALFFSYSLYVLSGLSLDT